MPLVSILLPTFCRNESGFLSRSIDSVLNQTFKDWELWIVDDGSTDGSQQTSEKAQETDPRVRVMRFEKNTGFPALTSARAYLAVDSQYISWAFDDCTWRPNLLEELVKAAASSDPMEVIYGQALMHFSGHSQIVGEPLDRDRMRTGNNHIAQGASLTPRLVHDTLGWVDPNILLKRNNDWDFWARCAEHAKLKFVPHVLAEEFGPSLADSLGNTVSLADKLMYRRAQSDRREELQFSRINDWDPFAFPAGFIESAEEAEQILFLGIEHYFRNPAHPEKDWTAGFNELRRLSGRSDSDFAAVTLKFTKPRQKALADEALASHAFIQEQRKTIDEGAERIRTLIDDLRGSHALADELRATIQEKQKAIDEGTERTLALIEDLRSSHVVADELRAAIQEKQKFIDGQRQSIDSLIDEIGTNKVELENLNKELQERNESIDNLNKIIEQMKLSSLNKDNMIAERDEALRNLRDQMFALRQTSLRIPGLRHLRNILRLDNKSTRP